MVLGEKVPKLVTLEAIKVNISYSAFSGGDADG
jgi:hypothetical protein